MKLGKKLILTAAMLGLVAAPAMAQDHSLGIEFRTDLEFNSSDRDSDLDVNEEDENIKFNVARARVNFRGDINELTSYRARVRFNRSFDQKASDNTSNALQMWYLDRKLSDTVNLRIGKVFVLNGSVENDYSGMDQYFYSAGNDALPAFYETGAEVSFAVANQTLAFQVLNAPAGQANQKALNLNAAWYGNLGSDKAIKVEPIVTYGIYPSTKQENAAGEETDAYNTTQYGVGTRIFAMNRAVQLDLEVDNVTVPEFDDEINGDQLEVSTDSVIVAAKYHTKHFTPFVKATQTSEDLDGDDVVDHQKLGAGVEWSPEGNGVKSYRVHAVVTQASTTYEDEVEGSLEDFTTNQVNIGVSARFN